MKTQELLTTTRIPAISMRELVYGLPKAERRTNRRDGFVVFAVAFGAFLGMSACATAPRPTDVETVGTLSASSAHVYTAPVHATTDLTPSFGVVDTDTDTDAAPTANPSESPNGSTETPDVAPKTSLVMGGAR